MSQYNFYAGPPQQQNVDTSNLTGLLSSINNLPSSQQTFTKFVNYDPSQDGTSVGDRKSVV